MPPELEHLLWSPPQAYNLENCYAKKDNCRLNFNAQVSQQELEDTYLPPFEAAVREGHASGLMCSCESYFRD